MPFLLLYRYRSTESEQGVLIRPPRQGIADPHILARNPDTPAGELATIGETEQGEGMARKHEVRIFDQEAFFYGCSAVERECPAGEGSA